MHVDVRAQGTELLLSFLFHEDSGVEFRLSALLSKQEVSGLSLSLAPPCLGAGGASS